MNEPKPLPAGYLRVQRTSEIDPAEGRVGEYVLRINWPGGEQVERILHDVLPRVIELFLQKVADYSNGEAVNWANVLGDRGQFADIWRKVGKLQTGLWEGRELTGESVEEVVMDLIGHCLLILEMRTRNVGSDGAEAMRLQTDIHWEPDGGVPRR